MAEPFSILFLPSWYPSRQHATLGNFVRRHAKAAALKNKISVVAAFPSQKDEMEIQESGDLLEIRVYFKKRLPIFSYEMAMQKGIREAERRRGEFDLAHVHVAWPAGLAALGLQIPFVVTEHFSGYQKTSGFRWGFWRKTLTKKIMNRAQLILPVSKHLGNAIRDFGTKTEIRQLSNVVDTSVFYPTENQTKKFVFLHVSTLEERSKNITGILAGFQRLSEKRKDFILKIGGDGDLEDLKSKIKSAKIPKENIAIFGEKPITEIAELMRNSDALVMFSHFENQPCTILEALCSGLPVVSSEVGGISEVVDAGNGILVEPENVENFAEALAEMMNRKEDFDTQKIARKAQEKFSYEKIAQELDNIYREILDHAQTDNQHLKTEN